MQRLMALMMLASLVGCGPATVAGAERRRSPDATPTVLVLPPRPGSAVEISDADFAATMNWLTADWHLPREPRAGRIVRASFEPDASGDLDLLQVQRLWRGYDAWCESMHQGPDCKELLSDGQGFTVDTKRSLGLAIALACTWDGIRDEAVETVSLARVVTLISTVLVSYTALWVLPEPTSKGLAATLTAMLWAYLGREFWDFVHGWIDMR